MKTWLLTFALLFSLSVWAHEGGHGELAESGKFGGITSPIVDSAQAGLGNKAKFLFKAELVRSESGEARLYIFDENMKLIDLSSFGNEVSAKLEMKKKGKFVYFGEFKLAKKSNHFYGQLPKVEYRPFNIDFYLTKGEQKLFVGFSNLD